MPTLKEQFGDQLKPPSLKERFGDQLFTAPIPSRADLFPSEQPIQPDRTQVVTGPEQPSTFDRLASGFYESRPRLAQITGEEQSLSRLVTPQFKRTGVPPIDLLLRLGELIPGVTASIAEDPIGFAGEQLGFPAHLAETGAKASGLFQDEQETAQAREELGAMATDIGLLALLGKLGGTLAKPKPGVGALSRTLEKEGARLQPGLERAFEAGEIRPGLPEAQFGPAERSAQVFERERPIAEIDAQLRQSRQGAVSLAEELRLSEQRPTIPREVIPTRAELLPETTRRPGPAEVSAQAFLDEAGLRRSPQGGRLLAEELAIAERQLPKPSPVELRPGPAEKSATALEIELSAVERLRQSQQGQVSLREALTKEEFESGRTSGEFPGTFRESRPGEIFQPRLEPPKKRLQIPESTEPKSVETTVGGRRVKYTGEVFRDPRGILYEVEILEGELKGQLRHTSKKPERVVPPPETPKPVETKPVAPEAPKGPTFELTPEMLARRAIEIERELLKEGKFKELTDLRQRRASGEFIDQEYISKLQDVIRPPETLPEVPKIKTEPTPAGEQVTIAPQRQVPTTKTTKVGVKKKVAPITQGDVFQPQKLKIGSLPQDQGGLFDKPAPGQKIPGRQGRRVVKINQRNREIVIAVRDGFKESGLETLEEPLFEKHPIRKGGIEPISIRRTKVSKTPYWWRGKNYNPKEMVKIADKVAKGESITALQATEFRRAAKDWMAARRAELTGKRDVITGELLDKSGSKAVAEADATYRKLIGGGDILFSGVPFSPEILASIGSGLVKNGKLTLEGMKKVTEFMKQAENRVELPGAKAVLEQVTRADEKWHRRAGQALDKLRSVLKKRLFQRKRTGEEIADAIEAGKEPKVDAVMKKIRDKAVELGVKIGYRGPHYFPRVWKHKISQQIVDDLAPLIKDLNKGTFSDQAIANRLKTTPQLGEIVDFVMAKNNIKTVSETLRLIERKAKNELFDTPSFVERRALEYPSWVYERDARIVLPRYVNQMTKYLAQIEAWGQPKTRSITPELNLKGEIIKTSDAVEHVTFDKLESQLADIAVQSIDEYKITQQIVDMWSGAFEKQHGLTGATKKAVDAWTAAQFGTKISLGKAIIPNLTQFAISTLELGPINLLRGAKRLITGESLSAIRQSGAYNKNLLESLTGGKLGGPVGRIVARLPFTKAFIGVNKFQAALAASTMEVTVGAWMKRAQGTGKRAVQAQRWLKDFGIDYTKPLTNNKKLEAMYRFATDSQLQRNVLKDPLFANDPRTRPFFLFKRFGYRQATRVKDIIKREMDRGNYMPLIRIVSTGAVAGIASGEAILWMTNMLYEMLSDEPHYRKEDLDTAERYLNDFAASGAFGVVGDMLDLDETLGGTLKSIGRNIEFQVTPVVISDAEKAFEAWDKFTAEWDKSEDFGQAFVKKGIPGITQFTGSMPRKFARRFATEETKESRMTFQKGRAHTEILDLILAGDGERAVRKRKLWDDNHPNDKFELKDIGLKELKARAKRNEKTGLKRLPDSELTPEQLSKRLKARARKQ